MRGWTLLVRAEGMGAEGRNETFMIGLILKRGTKRTPLRFYFIFSKIFLATWTPLAEACDRE